VLPPPSPRGGGDDPGAEPGSSLGLSVPSDFRRVPPEPILGGQPGLLPDLILGSGVVGVVLEVPKVERSASFHPYEITGAPSSKEVAHSDA
jgi:hypothetical protein